MSELFMDMQQRRFNNNKNSSTNSLNSSNYSGYSSQTKHSQQQFSINDGSSYGEQYSNVEEGGEDGNEDDEEEEDPLANLISLTLKKPQHWNWELTTSRSCTNIALPRILLYNQEGELLVDADGNDEGIYKSIISTPSTTRKRRTVSRRSSTTNLTSSIRKVIEREFNNLHIEEVTPSPEPHYSNSSERQRYQRRNHSNSTTTLGTNTSVDFLSNNLPDYDYSGRRSSSLRGVRFSDEQNSICSDPTIYRINDLPTPTTTTTTTTTTPTTGTGNSLSSGGGPREKRRYRRSNSSIRASTQSESILERLSYNRGRSSTPETCDELEYDENKPRFYLRTSKAGTIVVRDESFNRSRRRRRPPRNSSSEQLIQSNNDSQRSRSTSSLKNLDKQSRIASNILGQRNITNDTTRSLSNVRAIKTPEEHFRKVSVPARLYGSGYNMSSASRENIIKICDNYKSDDRLAAAAKRWQIPIEKFQKFQKSDNFLVVDPENMVRKNTQRS